MRNPGAGSAASQASQDHPGDNDHLPLKTECADRQAVYSTLVSFVRVRHYSPKTLKVSKVCFHHIQGFVKSKDPGM